MNLFNFVFPRRSLSWEKPKSCKPSEKQNEFIQFCVSEEKPILGKAKVVQAERKTKTSTLIEDFGVVSPPHKS